jgi:hypothetical protein
LQAQIKAAEQGEKDRLAAEAHAKMRAADPFYLLSQSGALRASLTLRGGSIAIKAVETLMDAGIVAVRHGALVIVKSGEEGKPERKPLFTSDKETIARREYAEGKTETPKGQSDQGEREGLRIKVRKFVSLGWRDGAIAKELGIPDSTVYSIRKRAYKAA